MTTATAPAPVQRIPYTHAALFREAAYEDGQPYASHDDLEDDGAETG
jgi:hypothetical protein